MFDFSQMVRTLVQSYLSPSFPLFSVSFKSFETFRGDIATACLTSIEKSGCTRCFSTYFGCYNKPRRATGGSSLSNSFPLWSLIPSHRKRSCCNNWCSPKMESPIARPQVYPFYRSECCVFHPIRLRQNQKC